MKAQKLMVLDGLLGYTHVMIPNDALVRRVGSDGAFKVDVIALLQAVRVDGTSHRKSDLRGVCGR